jgi:aerobic-type carbon monoxide dehydrogenase small subunit (CoxS/CutS family)
MSIWYINRNSYATFFPVRIKIQYTARFYWFHSQGKVTTMPTTNLLINGEMFTVDVSPEMPLLWVLRDELDLKGTKFGCGQGLCGSCTVHLDGTALRSCITPVSAAGGRIITTIEGLSMDGDHPLQLAWLAEKVPQCGYCQPGQIMAAAALLANNPLPTEAEIDAAMSDMLCRCGTYQRIRKAIHRAAVSGGGL